MRSRNATLGVLFATTTALVWGGQFVVGKSALETIDAFPLSTVRYALAAALWLLVLIALEGRASLRLDGRGWRLFWLGSLGFAGFNLFAYTGLAHARPETASLIVALAPLLTALVLWHRTRVRPARSTFVLLAVALVGVALVVSAGHPSIDPARCARLGRGARPRRCLQLRPLRPRRSGVHVVLSAPLHRADGLARLADDRRGDGRRDRDRPRRGSDGRAADVGLAADRLPGDPGRLRRRADVERGDQRRSARRTPSSSGT